MIFESYKGPKFNSEGDRTLWLKNKMQIDLARRMNGVQAEDKMSDWIRSASIIRRKSFPSPKI